MNVERAVIMQGPNRNIRRSIKRGPAEVVPKEPSSMLFQKDHELASALL
jgi:hypothetical protein